LIVDQSRFESRRVHPGQNIDEFVVSIFELKQALGGFFVYGDPGEHGGWDL